MSEVLDYPFTLEEYLAEKLTSYLPGESPFKSGLLSYARDGGIHLSDEAFIGRGIIKDRSGIKDYGNCAITANDNKLSMFFAPPGFEINDEGLAVRWKPLADEYFRGIPGSISPVGPEITKARLETKNRAKAILLGIAANLLESGISVCSIHAVKSVREQDINHSSFSLS